MTTEVYPRFLRLAAGKLIAVVVTLAEYFNILIDTRHMNVNIYTRCSHQLRPLAQSMKQLHYVLSMFIVTRVSPMPPPLPLYPLNLRLPRTRRGGCGISSIVGGRLGRKPRRADLDTSTLHCVTLRYIIATCKVGAYSLPNLIGNIAQHQEHVLLRGP